MKPKLTVQEIAEAACANGFELAALQAVLAVETRGKGFLEDGRPIILFERHRFHALTGGRFSHLHPYLSSSQPGGYAGGTREWDRLAAAIDLDREAALQSTSWGIGQVMGFHWHKLGYKDVQDLVNAAYRSEAAQLDMMLRYINHFPEAREGLRTKDWVRFAAAYNGWNYKKNAYDTKLAAAYKRYSED